MRLPAALPARVSYEAMTHGRGTAAGPHSQGKHASIRRWQLRWQSTNVNLWIHSLHSIPR